jgi:large subunit ribosomal protein L21e
MKGSHGFRRRTRSFSVPPRSKGKISIRARLAKFDEDEKVSIKINPIYQNIPHPRFQGLTGKVVGTQGRAYLVEVRTGGKTKMVLTTSEHLQRVQ